MGRLMGFRVAGTGSYVPERVVTNEDLAALGCDSDWIVRRTGILERRKAADDQATSDLCYEASLRCLAAAGKTAADVDLILVATITPDHPTPSTACLLQERLGARAPAMDIGAACAGFMYAMVTAAQFIASGNQRCVLVVGADLMTRTADPDDKKTYPLFGDGAGAVLLVPDESAVEIADPSRDPQKTPPEAPAAKGLLAYQLGSEGCGAETLCIAAGGTRQAMTPEAYARGGQFLRMDGRHVFKWAVRVFDESAKQVMKAADVDAADLDLLILHQANHRIIDSAVSDLNVDADKVFVNLQHYGNTSAASIPLVLDEAVRGGRIESGDLLLLCGFGAGLAWGTAVMRW